jgi:outer membrane protein OmpA-like peptidoglycan-associated protein
MGKFFTTQKGNGKYWVSISDMMSGLMMVFLFISITYMINVNREKDKIKEIAVTYNRLQNDLYQALCDEFKNDLKNWDANIDRQSLSVRFKSPEVFFKLGSYQLENKFKTILKDFFPRYIKILTNEKYKNDIEEIRIEGHTSTDWTTECPADIAYFKNMELSQDRTRSVLEYVLTLPNLDGNKDWIKKLLTANGLSSSKIVADSTGKEDKEKSRRVEFRVKTNSEKRIVKIINESE